MLEKAVCWKTSDGSWWFIPESKFGMGLFCNSYFGRGPFASQMEAERLARKLGFTEVETK